MTEENKNILVLINSSWGEIDWILPICKLIKDNYGNVKINVIFNCYDYRYIIKENHFSLELLSNCVHNYYDVSDFLPTLLKLLLNIFKFNYDKNKRHSIFSEYIHNKILNFISRYNIIRIDKTIIQQIQPDVLLKDLSGDTNLKKKITSEVMKRSGKVIIFPHGTLFFLESTFSPRKDIQGDLLLCTSKNTSEVYGKMIPNIKTAIVGNPRYDNWWIKYIQKIWSNKNKLPAWTSLGKFNILFITRGPDSHYLSKDAFDYLISETIKIVLSIPNTYLLVRPHPRSSPILLEQYLNKYDKSRWSIDTTDPFCLSGHIDLVVSMWSSMILDALAIGVPVIEFFRFNNSKYPWAIDNAGNPTTVYRKLGIVMPANNSKELKYWINKCLKNPKNELNKLINNYTKLMPKNSNTATIKAVKCIMEDI